MTVKDMQGVLCGAVTLYEEVPRADAGRPPLPGEWYRDLYTGMSQEIPEEFARRGVLLVIPGSGGRPGRIEIQLEPEAGDAGRRAKKKVHEKSPA